MMLASILQKSKLRGEVPFPNLWETDLSDMQKYENDCSWQSFSAQVT